MDSDIRIIEIKPFFIDTSCRSPLKFGAVVVESLHFCQVEAHVQNRAGKVTLGRGGIFLMDSWCFPAPAIEHAIKDK